MSYGELSEKIRERAVRKYVTPALQSGHNQFSVQVKELMHELEAEGFPPNHPAQFCTAMQKQSFLSEHGLEIERIDGPPSKKSTTVVFHYRVKRRARGLVNPTVISPGEDAATRARRLTGKLRGLLKKELAGYGGAEAFIRWVRSEDNNP